jgi:hypothetical protein
MQMKDKKGGSGETFIQLEPKCGIKSSFFYELIFFCMTGKVLRRELQEKDIEKIKKGKEIKG